MFKKEFERELVRDFKVKNNRFFIFIKRVRLVRGLGSWLNGCCVNVEFR